MKTVQDIIDSSKALVGQLTLKASAEGDIHIKGTPEAFRTLAAILSSQADRLGSNQPPCASSLVRGEDSGVILSPESATVVWMHCHAKP